jgi:hypothetical protein
MSELLIFQLWAAVSTGVAIHYFFRARRLRLAGAMMLSKLCTYLDIGPTQLLYEADLLPKEVAEKIKALLEDNDEEEQAND